MSRGGLYKSDIKKARDSLIAQGVNPSVDAVRVALGNTGSKTTIHKYLKELNEGNGGAESRKTSVSEALQDLIGRLAAQLHDEANLRVEQAHIESQELESRHTTLVAELKRELLALESKLQRAEGSLQEEKTAHLSSIEALQSEKIIRHTLDQHVIDLKERLSENDRHRLSLEEKHQHAREALEHYRASVKEQRDQDQRRHEQQIQQLQAEMRQLQHSLVIKQNEVTRLNQESARLVADLSHAQTSLYEQQTRNRQLEQNLETMSATEQRAASAEVLLIEKEKIILRQAEHLTQSKNNIDTLIEKVRDLELDLSANKAKLDTQQSVLTELRAYMELKQGKDAEKI